jgi:hypothetical protein
MKEITIVYVCDGIVGEAQGVFDKNNKLIGAWSCNDGDWRGEYFNPFMEKLGIKVNDGEEATQNQLQQIKDYFGL